MLDPVIRDLAKGKNFGSISFHLPNDAIATHVMWVDADEEHLMINTEVHRTKYKAMQANPNVTVTIWSSDTAYSYAEVRGRVTGEIRGPRARSGIDDLSQKYKGTPYQPRIQSERVILQITPIRQRTQGL
ncbi:MAG TPA: PPOX class F420-dependent oxidoreductase [Ilumatobacteraceae bacterium]|nr:PPOX class F420-dependent oxidoreductase [Ilumatobacteraceae bacterium]